MSWSLSGEYLENCNCDVLCPCITSSLQGPADHDRCILPMAMRFDAGSADGVSLAGLGAILIADTPQVMAEGGWRVAVYIDERADEAQREALVGILSGAQGGPPAMLAGLVGEMLGVKFVPMEWSGEGDRRRVTVPGVLDFDVEGLRAPGGEDVIRITGVFHPMGSDLAVAQSRTGTYSDDLGIAPFDHTGRNANYRRFDWAA
jgi:hypothetical protein